MAINHIVGGRGSTGSASYAPVQLIIPPYPVALPPFFGIKQLPPVVAAAASPNAAAPTFSVDWTTSSTIPSQITTARSSAANYYNSSGTRASATSGTARIDYIPGTLVRAGLLGEEQRTNIYLRSDDAWNGTGVVNLVNGTIAQSTVNGADGTTKLALLQASSSGLNQCFAYQNPTMTSGATYTYSADVKLQDKNQIGLLAGSSTTNVYATIIFDFTTGKITQTAVGSAGGTLINTFVIPLPNGIYRVGLTASMTNANSWIIEQAGAATGNTFASNGTVTYTTTVSQGILFGGMMVELGASPTSHIVTTTASVTRSADIFSSTDATLLAAKGWIAEVGEIPVSSAKTFVGVNTVIGIGEDANNLFTTTDGVTLTTIYGAAASDPVRAGFAWDSTPRVSISAGGSSALTAANTATTPTTLYFGNTNNGASGFLNGHIRMMACYSTLDDTQLEYLTPPGTSFTITGSSVNAVVNQTLGALTTAATAQVIASAVIDQTLAALGQSFASTVIDAATTAQTLGTLQQVLSATIPDTAVVAQTLAALTQAATAISLSVLNPADKDPSITLSNGNLTATGSLNGDYNVRGTWPGVAGRYFEITFSTLVASGVGVANLSQSLTVYPGDPNSAAWFSSGYTEWPGSGSAINFGGIATGDVVGVLLEASDVKFYKNGTLVGTATALPTSTLYPIVDVGHNGDVGTVNFGATALSYLPAGATSWDGSQTSGARTAVVAQTLGGLVQTTPAAVTVAGVIAQTLGALSQTATATTIDTASVTQTLGALTQTATATVGVAAAVAQTLGALGQTTTATVAEAAVVAQTLGALSQSLTATIADAAAVSQTLGALGQTTTAAATDTATTSQTLGALNQTATAIHQAASAVVNQTLGALGQTATAAATDTAAVAQTLGALQQALTAAAEVAATTAQTLGALQQLAGTAVTDTATFQGNLGALQQTATGAAEVNAAVIQLLGDLGQTATVAVVGQAIVDQTLPSLEQELIISDSRHAHVTETLGDLAQTAASTVDITAAIAQTLGGLTQLTGATVDILVNTIQTLGTLAQVASATAPTLDVIDALVAQSLAVLGQAASGQVTVATAVSQVLATLGQITTGGPQTTQVLQLEQTLAGNVLVRATLSQLLQGLQQAAATVLPPATTIMPESVVTVMYEHRILVVPSEARVLVVPGMYVNAFAGGQLGGVGPGGDGGGLGGPVIRLPGEHLLPPIQQVLTTTGADLGPALPDNIIVLEEDTFSALLWEDGSFFEMEDDTVSVLSIDNAVTLEEGGFLLTEASDSLGLEDQTIAVIATLPADLGLLLEDGSALLTEDGFFLGTETVVVAPTGDLLLLEDGSVLLLEDGDFFGLESGEPIGAGVRTVDVTDMLQLLRQRATVSMTGIHAQRAVPLPALQQGAQGIIALGAGQTTFNPNDKSPSVALSNGNLTAAGTGMARGTKPGQVDKYFEFVFSNIVSGSTSKPGVGVANLTQSLAGYMGNPNGVGYFADGYAEWPGSGFDDFVATFAAGDVLGICLRASPSTPIINTVLNAADKYADIVLSNGDLTATYTTSNASGNVNVRGTTAGITTVRSRYFEVKFTTYVTGQTATPGVGVANLSQSLTSYPGNPNSAAWYANNYAEWPGGFSGGTGFGTFAANDVLGVLLGIADVKFYKNGTLAGTATALPSGALYPVISLANNTESAIVNFGATPLAHLPTGTTSWDGSQAS